MDSYFDREFTNTEKELLRLKTSSTKSAGAVGVVSKSVDVSVNLQYEEISYPTGSARASKYYEIETTHNAIVIPTLDWYSGNIMDVANVQYITRQIKMTTGEMGGKYNIELYFIGTEQGDNSDAARTKRGETVTVTCKLTIYSTQDFTIKEYTP